MYEQYKIRFRGLPSLDTFKSEGEYFHWERNELARFESVFWNAVDDYKNGKNFIGGFDHAVASGIID